jgi:hypothetical protein
VRLILQWLGRNDLLYPVTFLLAGLSVVQNQVDMQGDVKVLMTRTESQTGEIAAIAVWVRSHVAADAPLYSDRPATLTYYTGRPVSSAPVAGASPGGFVVAGLPPGPGFTVAYRLPASPEAPGTGYAVWRKE